MTKEKVKLSGFLVQFLATMSIGYLTSLTGFIYAWPSYTVQNFVSNETILSRPMSTNEISFLGSITNLGGLLATPFCGFIVDGIGRKKAAMLFGLPHVLAWLAISLTTSVPLVIAAIGFAGIGAAGQAISSIYIAEICQDSIRGGMSSIVVSGYFMGLLMSYTLGGQLTYYQIIYTHLAFSVLYVVILMFLKESPVYLVQNGREEEAAQSIAFYRRVDVTSKEVETAISKIKLQLDPRIDRILQGDNDPAVAKELLREPEERKPVSPWKFLKNSESTKRALTTCLVLMALSIMMGAIVLQVYAEPLFREAVPSMPPNLCAIFLAVDLLVASIICALLVERLGRKNLMTITALGTGFCTIVLGAQLQFHFAPHWFTAFIIYFYCFVYNLGAATVPFILPAEVFLPEARGLCNSITIGCMWCVNFLTLVVFNPLVGLLGLGPIFYGFSIMCFLTALYSHMCLKETKGLSVDAIQLLFLKETPQKDKA